MRRQQTQITNLKNLDVKAERKQVEGAVSNAEKNLSKAKAEQLEAEEALAQAKTELVGLNTDIEKARKKLINVLAKIDSEIEGGSKASIQLKSIEVAIAKQALEKESILVDIENLKGLNTKTELEAKTKLDEIVEKLIVDIEAKEKQIDVMAEGIQVGDDNIVSLNAQSKDLAEALKLLQAEKVKQESILDDNIVKIKAQEEAFLENQININEQIKLLKAKKAELKKAESDFNSAEKQTIKIKDGLEKDIKKINKDKEDIIREKEKIRKERIFLEGIVRNAGINIKLT